MELLGRYSKLPKLPDFRGAPQRTEQAIATHRVHKAQRRLPPEAIANLASEYEAGQSTTVLMERYSLGKGTVLSLLRATGVKIRSHGQRNIDLAEAIERYRTGWSLAKLAAAYDCNAETVRTALKSADVRMRRPWDHPQI